LFTLTALCSSAWGAEIKAAAHFRKDIQPILTEYCYDCHGDGMDKGNVAFDEFKSDEELLGKRDLWWAVLKNLRAGIMPPAKKPRPPETEKRRLEDWIKYEAFGIDPKDPDPGRVTIRRLNRVEYRNTIRDLMGIDFKAAEEFPPDDTGYGFDNIGDVLTVSPLLLEKYMQAAETIVAGSRASFHSGIPHAAAGIDPAEVSKIDGLDRTTLELLCRRITLVPIATPMRRWCWGPGTANVFRRWALQQALSIAPDSVPVRYAADAFLNVFCHLAGGTALIDLPPPNRADAEFWRRWLRLRADRFPYVWPNHREVIGKVVITP